MLKFHFYNSKKLVYEKVSVFSQTGNLAILLFFHWITGDSLSSVFQQANSETGNVVETSLLQ